MRMGLPARQDYTTGLAFMTNLLTRALQGAFAT